MKAEISQLITLTSAANGVLNGRLDPGSLYPANPAFTFCNSVLFVDLKRSALGEVHRVERHADPNAWLRSLAPAQARRAWLTYGASGDRGAPDHQLAAFVGGGGEWTLVVSFKSSTEEWISRWEVTDPNAPDRRIWRVTYGCVAKLPSLRALPEPRLEETASRLNACLNDAHKFASAHGLSFWADWFAKALHSLDPQEPVAFPEYVELVCLDSYPETAQRLLAAAYNGWVFGGMGSWNDLGFESPGENARYVEISKGLYSAITDAIQQATWSFQPLNAA